MTSQDCDAYTRRFFNFVMIKSSSNKKFHKTSKLDNVINDHHANFGVSDVTMGGARSFLRFYSMGRAGWGKMAPKFFPDHSAPGNRCLFFGLSGLGSFWP